MTPIRHDSNNLYIDKVTQILNKIKGKRAIMGYSQEYMGELLGVDYSSYGRVENNKSSLKFDLLFKIAGILELNLEDLFTFGPSMPPDERSECTDVIVRMEIPLKNLKAILNTISIIKGMPILNHLQHDRNL